MVKVKDERLRSVFLSLGSNLGNRSNTLELAKKLIENSLGNIEKMSSLYETSAWGNSALNVFLNQVVEIKTKDKPEEVLTKCLEIESDLGRKRNVKQKNANNDYVNRPIDIDILFYENIVFQSEYLTIPHPLVHKRMFVMVPLNEICPELLHPVFKSTIEELLKKCKDNTRVSLFKT